MPHLVYISPPPPPSSLRYHPSVHSLPADPIMIDLSRPSSRAESDPFLVHPASLIHPSLHPPPLLELLNIDISYDLVSTSFIHIMEKSCNDLSLSGYVTDHVASITCYGMDWPSTRRSSLSRRANLFSFISHVLITANIQTPGLLVTLSYIDKAKLFLQVSNDLWACERVFLGALILAHKVRLYWGLDIGA